jgi:hypothetical protein
MCLAIFVAVPRRDDVVPRRRVIEPHHSLSLMLGVQVGGCLFVNDVMPVSDQLVEQKESIKKHTCGTRRVASRAHQLLSPIL